MSCTKAPFANYSSNGYKENLEEYLGSHLTIFVNCWNVFILSPSFRLQELKSPLPITTFPSLRFDHSGQSVHKRKNNQT